MRKAAYTVDPLSQLKMSWLLRQRLRRVRERQLTGLLMQGIIRTPGRSMSSKNPAVSIWQGDTRIMQVIEGQRPEFWSLAITSISCMGAR